MKAYLTLLSNDTYLPGVQVLNRSLKAVSTQYPLFCMLSVSIRNESQQILEAEGISCIRLCRSAVEGNINPTDKSFSHWNYTFDKLFAWGLIQFEKVVFLDSDMLIIRNIDHLFEKEPFSAVAADCSFPKNEKWIGGLNSGLIIIKPNKEVEKKLLSLIKPTIKKARLNHLNVGDQDVVKSFLPNWSESHSLHLDEGYNLFADHLSYYIRHLEFTLNRNNGKPIFVIHFIGKAKPWMKKTLRQYLWFCIMCLKNPYYYTAYKMFTKYL